MFNTIQDFPYNRDIQKFEGLPKGFDINKILDAILLSGSFFKCVLWKTTAKRQVYRFTSIIAYIDLKILICRLVRNYYQYVYKRLVYFNFMPDDSLMWIMNLSLPHLRTIFQLISIWQEFKGGSRTQSLHIWILSLQALLCTLISIISVSIH